MPRAQEPKPRLDLSVPSAGPARVGVVEHPGPVAVIGDLVKNRPADLLWAFNDPEAMPPVDRPVIMGHVPRARPMDRGDAIAIDTGSGTRKDGG
jgi:hypothetical protein